MVLIAAARAAEDADNAACRASLPARRRFRRKHQGVRAGEVSIVSTLNSKLPSGFFIWSIWL